MCLNFSLTLVIAFQASMREEMWVLRVAILVVGTLCTVIAINVDSIYGLFFLCSDLVYVILFPQLLCVLWIPFSNSYGCIVSYFLGLFVRFASGELLIGLPPLIKFPLYTEEHGQGFPIRTFSMLVSLVFLIGVSFATDRLFKRNILPKRYDILKCVVNLPPEAKLDNNNLYDEQMEFITEKITVL